MVFASQLGDSVPPAQFKDLVSNFFWHQLEKFRDRTLFVEHKSGHQWTGAQIKHSASLIASRLIQLDHLSLGPSQEVMMFYPNSVKSHLCTLASLFAGCSMCLGYPDDPEFEQFYQLSSLKPKLVLVRADLLERFRSIRDRLKAESADKHFALVVMNDDDEPNKLELRVEDGEFGLHKHLLSEQLPIESSQSAAAAPELPVQVDPNRPAFVLFTSGSTGKPKPVPRSQRNALWVCHSLPESRTEHLWNLGAHSVLAGHIALDHGTGAFCLKMCLSKGLRLIVMPEFDCKLMREAVERHQISDIIMGSALLHNFMVEQMELERASKGHTLGSLRNLIATGSPLVSWPTASQFWRLYPECSVRQAFGMGEFGFISIQERSSTPDELAKQRSVGQLLPNVSIKLVEQDNLAQEICRPNCQGLLWVAGPTLSPGYLHAEFGAQTKQLFSPSGFYMSSDLATIQVDERSKVPHTGQPVQRLHILGRTKEVMVLYDGWKVLPIEMEQLLQQHPAVLEAAVVGVPDPKFPSSHLVRAYVVLRRNVRLERGSKFYGKLKLPEEGAENGQASLVISEKDLYDFVAERCAEPKHLLGGLVLLDQLPRLAIGKVDKKLLLKRDGFEA